MSIDRKTAEVRERELRLAMSRIQRGRSRTKAERLSIASVAREAGVTAALIHNHYPGLAAAIRDAMGRGERSSREAANQDLKALRARAQELNEEVKALRTDVAKLASINEALLAENASFKTKGIAPKVVALVSPAPCRSNP
jgi:AcrR family transcriptional regulator